MLIYFGQREHVLINSMWRSQYSNSVNLNRNMSNRLFICERCLVSAYFRMIVSIVALHRYKLNVYTDTLIHDSKSEMKN